MSYYYVLNSFYSDADITMETTSQSCYGYFNGVSTVCQYAADVPPNKYVPFAPAALLHVQTSPNNPPKGVYDLGNLQITVNKASGSITVAPWGGPNAGGAQADKLSRVEPARPKESKKPPESKG